MTAAHALGLPPGHVVSAAVFTTQTITSPMERIRDVIKAGVPDPADFNLGPNGERTVSNRSDVRTVVFRQQTSVSGSFMNLPINIAQLDAVPGAVGIIAYGRYTSPYYLVPGEYIPPTGTLTGTPQPQGSTTVYFTLYLPSGPCRPNNVISSRSRITFRPLVSKNPHTFAAQPKSPNPTVQAISLGAQEQLATFFESQGTRIVEATPTDYFETPIRSPLPETLNFIR